MYGNQPQILASVQTSSVTAMQSVLGSSEWEELTRQLLDYVEDFKYKIVPARSGFQL
jgi:hypothetical protein